MSYLSIDPFLHKSRFDLDFLCIYVFQFLNIFEFSAGFHFRKKRYSQTNLPNFATFKSYKEN